MDCPNCGKQNSDDTPLCSSCGWVLCWKPSVQNDKVDGNTTVSVAKRVVSIFALCAGITTFCNALAVVPVTAWFAFSPIAGGDFDFIGLFLLITSMAFFWSFYPVAAISLVLSIVALFIDRRKYLPLLALAFVLAGIRLFVVCYDFPG